ncbi:MAG: hypothetical protein PHE86_04700 [Candidatus Marinimicrobia bacterium]|nr:hypothetical protein [Candidatus Neomarinimicrobiota bacterium]MDD5582061.1 hypothetical protein [Candidatus Neomarinimicrobiota bacterium]
MKKLPFFLAGIVLIGCSFYNPYVFNPSWKEEKISAYINTVIQTQDYSGFVEDFGEPDTLFHEKDKIIAVWIMNNDDVDYMLRFIFDEETLRSNTWSYVKM